ncbi:hypothetical protein [Paractinoplanes toevensis]|uniref:Uncharacterized protein n=1 Tax=Paractinoplanes toevensis TaxID=571911 RepID=A0A919T7K6_9ACTN|nr:hypothetical protein [Actinoplanes toevensis]GIM90313.1 hypothetical protein Ato02nite_021060 [Actinoplanes toevensis]
MTDGEQKAEGNPGTRTNRELAERLRPALNLIAFVLVAAGLVTVLLGGPVVGLVTIVVVAALAVVTWLLYRRREDLRGYLMRGPAWVRDLVDGSEKASTLTRKASSLTEHAALAAVLALVVVVVDVAVTGRLTLGVALVAALLGLFGALTSKDSAAWLIVCALAAILAVVTVFAADMFRGGSDARGLAISVAAVVLPVVISNPLFGQLNSRIFARRKDDGGSRLTLRHQVVLVVLTVTLGTLGVARDAWLPGVTHSCYTLPRAGGIIMLRTDAQGHCYGLLDDSGTGVFTPEAFGIDPVTRGLQQKLLNNNRSIDDGDLTVVWLGSLSCDTVPSDSTRCSDGRDYPSERDQLRGLLFAQTQLAAVDGGHRLHVVIADATQDVRHIEDVARMIVERRDSLGRMVVIGGGDSRDSTQRAINRLLDAGIPFIAPNLLADLGAPSRPFVDRPGYLQLGASNMDFAEDTAARLTHLFPDGFRLDIFQHPDPTDQYTTSLVNDLLTALRAVPHATGRRVPDLAGLDASVCAGPADGPPTVLFFADRWTRFAEFVQRVNSLCGHSKPRLVIADSSVSRFIADYQLRAVTNANWPIDYYASGPACADLSPSAYATLTAQAQASAALLKLPAGFACADRTQAGPEGELLRACTLDAAAKRNSQPCTANDLGSFLVPAYDAAMLADALLPAERLTRDELATLNLPSITLATGNTASVRDGRLLAPTIAVRLWHVDPLYDPTRIWERPSTELTLPSDSGGGIPRP